jgi:hypothetical protein
MSNRVMEQIIEDNNNKDERLTIEPLIPELSDSINDSDSDYSDMPDLVDLESDMPDLVDLESDMPDSESDYSDMPDLVDLESDTPDSVDLDVKLKSEIDNLFQTYYSIP